MRIIAIGLGGAGCRIVDSLYAADRKSSRVACVHGLAVDVDETTLTQLSDLPDSAKIYFPPFNTEKPGSGAGGPTATIDIADIVSRVHNEETGENDAILVCAGLGGSMADIVPHVIAGLRSSIVEPIFGLVTLPCLAEGERRSSKAADDIDVLSPLLDGMILFDNETWFRKTRALQEKNRKKERGGFVQMLGLGKSSPDISPELETYLLLNEAIVRRISLILKAGEFRADGGIDLAEVVLDSGEVLNTMKGMGFITIGYAVDHLPSNPLAFLSQLKPAGLFNEESKKRASRIVELAKQAIYHEISTPCDMTSAHKALVLVAGPSHELSMQGFMTVRKWIDRSIRGLETRSGDYPVMNTKNVAIIIMLSGLENIPRISELREIREQIRHGVRRTMPAGEEETTIQNAALPAPGQIRDDMIAMPAKAPKQKEAPRHPQDMSAHDDGGRKPISEPDIVARESVPKHEKAVPVNLPRYQKEHTVASAGGIPSAGEPPANTEKGEDASSHAEVPHRRIVSQEPDRGKTKQLSQQPLSHEPPSDHGQIPKTRPPTQSHDIARLRIEQELQKQRTMAISRNIAPPARGEPGSGSGGAPPEKRSPAVIHPKKTILRHDMAGQMPPATSGPIRDQGAPAHHPPPTKTTVVVRKKSPAHESPEPSEPDLRGEPGIPEQSETTSTKPAVVHQESSESPVNVRDSPLRARDSIFLGKTVTGTAIPRVRDSALLHTSLKSKKIPAKPAEDMPPREPVSEEESRPAPQHKAKKVIKTDENP